MQTLPRRLFQSRIIRAVGAAALLASTVLSLIIWSNNWDNPPPQSLTTPSPGQITYKGVPIEVTIDCDCPTVLIESRARVLPFIIHLKRAAAPIAVAALPTLPATSPPERVYVALSAGNAAIDPAMVLLTDSAHLLSNTDVSQTVTLKVTPQDTTLSQITFQFETDTSLGLVTWGITSRSRFISVIAPYALSCLVFAFAGGAFFWAETRLRLLREHTERKLAEARNQADANPERARFAWDLARVKLEAYFDRNLIQVNMVFWVAVFVMAAGFGFVLAGVVLSFSHPQITPTSKVAAVSGIITQFIGATFMVIYRSTLTQANEFMTVLERINTVGMAVQVLDTLPEGTDLKNTTRANLAILLLDRNAPSTRTTGKSPTKKSGPPRDQRQ